MRIFLLLLSTVFCFCWVDAQPNEGSIKIYRSIEIDQMVERHRRINEQNKKVKGYRVQLIASGNRDEVNNIKARFLSRYPSTKTYFTFEEPNFKLKVGNFIDRLEATKFLKELTDDFVEAYLVVDMVEVKEL